MRRRVRQASGERISRYMQDLLDKERASLHAVRVMKTNEELMIARHTRDVIRGKEGGNNDDVTKIP
jgi:acetate kinase